MGIQVYQLINWKLEKKTKNNFKYIITIKIMTCKEMYKIYHSIKTCSQTL